VRQAARRTAQQQLPVLPGAALMLHTLLIRLQACRHPMRAWLAARLATPEADRSIKYWKAQSEARHS